MSSSFIPFDILAEEIIKRVVDMKCLLRLRSVSKQWKCFIDSPKLIGHHYNFVKQTHPPNLLLSYRSDEEIYASIVDDHSFPHNKFYPTLPPVVELIAKPVIMGCSHGLVCLSRRCPEPVKQKELIVIWNPSIRKSVGIMLPQGRYVIGFGVCPKTLDPKIVKITTNTTTCMDQKAAEVFSVSNGAWKSVDLGVPPLNIEGLGQEQIVIDGAIHWTDYDLIEKDFYCHRIVSFNLTSEKFGQVHLPDTFSHGGLDLFKFKESLGLLSRSRIDGGDVWMMIKDGDSECSFAKLFSVTLLAFDGLTLRSLHINGSRKNGQLMTGRMVQHLDADRTCVSLDLTLEVYEPYTQHSKELEFDRIPKTLSTMASYTESLLLLNQSESIIQC